MATETLERVDVQSEDVTSKALGTALEFFYWWDREPDSDQMLSSDPFEAIGATIERQHSLGSAVTGILVKGARTAMLDLGDPNRPYMNALNAALLAVGTTESNEQARDLTMELISKDIPQERTEALIKLAQLLTNNEL